MTSCVSDMEYCKEVIDLFQRTYLLEVRNVTFVDRSETELYRVESDQGPFAVKIYDPDPTVDFSVYGVNRYSAENIEGIMSLLMALSADCADKRFSYPIPLKRNSFVQMLSRGRICTVTSWISGFDLIGVKTNNDFFYKIGVMLASFHEHATQIAKRKNVHLFSGSLLLVNEWRGLIRSALNISDQVRNKLMSACDLIDRASFFLSDQDTVVVHGDFSRSNIIRTLNGFGLIDYSLCSYAPLYLDLGSLAFELPEQGALAALVGGYSDYSCRKIDVEKILIFRLFRVMLYVVANIQHMKDCSWIQGDPLAWAENLWMCKDA